MNEQRWIRVFLLGNGVGLGGLLFCGAMFNAWILGFLVWNLLLGALPALLVQVWLETAHKNGWLSWKSVIIGLAWLGFLPNSFYLVTDLTHLWDMTPVAPLWAEVLVFGWFAVLGIGLAIAAVAPLHKVLRKQLGFVNSWWTVETVWLLSAIGVYLGKVLRWNTWDVIIHPVGLIQDLANGLGLNARNAGLIALLWAGQSVVYWIVWRLMRRSV